MQTLSAHSGTEAGLLAGSYFGFMWNHEHGGKLHHHTSISFVELPGEHRCLSLSLSLLNATRSP
jgi:hypothetical protein